MRWRCCESMLLICAKAIHEILLGLRSEPVKARLVAKRLLLLGFRHVLVLR
jgi:hypothetical protein